ncbi:MAG TPA: hypothetical protein VMZ27_06120 [Candidatus Saccharimonadales bacterium]|nr:hypothetical protein [Candidatus Saccharimonadales bacterium]
MATGLQLLQAISDRRRGWPPNAEFKICALDAVTLLTLSFEDLLAEKFRDTVAEEVVSALKVGDISPLAQRLGIKFVYSDEAAPLVVEEPTPVKAKRVKAKKKKPVAKKKPATSKKRKVVSKKTKKKARR